MTQKGMDPWLAPVRQLLEGAAAQERVRTFWWRDDDAVRPGPRLSGLFAAAREVGAQVAIAAIPADTTPALLEACAAAGAVVWQHGVSHANHQTMGKSAELGDARSVDDIVRACAAARDRLLCEAFEPVMVPPWNRMREDLAPALALAGYQGVSRFGGPRIGAPLARLDTHIDPVDWRGGRGLVAPAQLAAQVERAGAQDGPIGLLTHHAIHDEAVTAFVSALARLVRDHPGGAWVAPMPALAGAAASMTERAPGPGAGWGGR